MNITFVNSMRMYGGAEVWQLDTLHRLNKLGHNANLIAQPGTTLANKAGSICTEIPIRFDTAPWTIFKLYKHFKRHNTEAILCNTIKDLKAAGVAAKLAGVEVILLSRESDVPLKNRFYYRFYLNKIATSVLVNSNATMETTKASAPWINNLQLLYKGIDLSVFSITSFPQRPTLGFAGEISARKGVPELMKAWESVENSIDADLIIRGHGNIDLENWKLNLHNPEKVFIEPWSDNMQDFYAKITALVLPSYNEGFGLVAAEAMAAGKPVIASNCSSLPEVVGEAGLFIEPGDSEKLANSIIELLSDKTNCEILGSKGRSRIEREFNIDSMLNQLTILMSGERNE